MNINQQFLTPSAERILGRCQLWGFDETLPQAVGQLVVAILIEESLAAACLNQAGVTLDSVRSGQLGSAAAQIARSHPPEETKEPDSSTSLPSNHRCGQLLADAARVARLDPDANGISSRHLLAVVMGRSDPVAESLRAAGLTFECLAGIRDDTHADAIPVPALFRIGPDPDTPVDSAIDGHISRVFDVRSVERVLDACLNRAREGLRVLEDYARFFLNDPESVRSLKELRHRLVASEGNLRFSPALHGRNVSGDVGTGITTHGEEFRGDPQDIVQANARRIQESLRSLEEFGKLVSRKFAAQMKQLRYSVYGIHQQLLTGMSGHGGLVSRSSPLLDSVDCSRRQRLQRSLLCVLVTESGCRIHWKDVVHAVLEGGADILQLREKQLNDRELSDRAGWLSETCHAANALCIINDRPDIAFLSGSDGVHLGQDDSSVRQARAILGEDLLIGVSTHCPDDLTCSNLQFADYLGAGPVFASQTKEFSTLAGPDYLQQMASVSIPWFAIGGIGLDNLSDLTAAGTKRIAVSSAVINAKRPDEVTRQLKYIMETTASERIQI